MRGVICKITVQNKSVGVQIPPCAHMKTPKTDNLEKTRIALKGERCPAYGDALRRLRKYEDALWKIRESNSRYDTVGDNKRIARNVLEGN